MKRHNTFKVLGIVLVLVLIVSYFLTSRSGTIDYAGIFDTLMNFFKSMYFFFYIVIFLLTVGGLYGVLSKTPSYKKLLDNIVSVVKPMGKKFLFVLIIVLAVISSFTGLVFPLVLFLPLIGAIILLLGYDKLVAVSATVGSMIVGYMGGVFVTFINPNTNTLNTYETYVGLESQFSNVFPKLLLLFAGIALLIGFINSYIVRVENKKVKYELDDDSSVVVNEVKADYKDIKVWPMAVTLCALFVLLVLGAFPFVTLFNVTFFDSLHADFVSLTIGKILVRLVVGIVLFGLVILVKWIICLIKKKEFKFKVGLPIWLSVIGLVLLEIFHVVDVADLYNVSFMKSFINAMTGNAFLDFTFFTNSIFSEFTAFGTWFSSGESYGYLNTSLLVFLFTIIVAIVGKVKFDDVIDASVEGIKKIVPTVMITMLAYTILVVSYTNGFVEQLITNYGKFNFGISSLLSLLGSIVTVDLYYIAAGVFSPILELVTDESISSSIAVLFQGIYGIFMILSPTSLVLLFAISYFDVPYTTWIKYIWRFILGLIILLAFVILLISLL